MVVKLKLWGDVVNEAKHRGKYDYNTGRVFCLGEDSLPWGRWVYSEMPNEDGDYFVSHGCWVRPYMIAEVENDFCEMPTSDDVLRYGKIITDDAYASVVTEFGRRQTVRIRLISYNGDLWYHKVSDGDVVECSKVGKADGTK